MAVKRYNGSSWDVVAGLGAQGPAATSSSIATWVKTASGGETSLSGNDDNSQSLSYTVGQELVFINGALQKRGVDYTATTGTSITGLTALAASDVVTVWTVNAFSVTNAISNTLVDAKGDLITATGSDVPARLAVGTDGQVLTASSTASTGLSWSTPTSSDWVKIENYSWTSVTSITRTIFSSAYDVYKIVVACKNSSGAFALWQLRTGSTTSTASYYDQRVGFYGTTVAAVQRTNQSNAAAFAAESGNDCFAEMIFIRPYAAQQTGFWAQSIAEGSAGYTVTGVHRVATSYDQLVLTFGGSGETNTGQWWVYGMKA